ncbi:hypothetical protein CYMTET_24580, partial [Cymbomonas tetramitiformis]
MDLDASKRSWGPGVWRKLTQEIHKNQFPARAKAQQMCGRNRTRSDTALAYAQGGNVGLGGMGAGVASTVHFISGYLSEALLEKKPFVFYGRFNYASNSVCRSAGKLADFECYLQPFSACSSLKTRLSADWKPPKISQNRGCVLPATPHKWCSEVAHFLRVPNGELGRRGTFWFRSALVSFLMRLNAGTKSWLGLPALKKRIGFKGPIIGVHVRHGDACETTDRKVLGHAFGRHAVLFPVVGGGRCKGLEAYIPAIQTLSERYNTTRVYLATDDEAIIA